MKSLKKNIFIFLFLLIGVFFFNVDRVEANIVWEGVTIECIYSSGSLYEYSYNDYSGEWSLNRYTYSLKGVDSSRMTTSGSYIYSSTDGVPIYEDSNKIPHCLAKEVSSLVNTEDDDGNDTTITYTKFLSSSSTSEDFTDSDFGEHWWNYFGWWNQSTAEEANNGSKETYKLVSENYILTDDAGDPIDTYSYKREDVKDEGEVTQAVSVGTYLTVLDYGDVQLIQSKSKTNFLSTNFSKSEVVWFTDADPKTYSGSGTNVSYYYESAKFTYVIPSNDSSTPSDGYYRYVYAGNVDTDGVIDSGALCDKIMPKTAENLATVIKWAQFLVPVLLILFTGLDIAKIVFAGNVEEELPKKKKSIITRFIVAIVFFFLPLIVNLLLSYVKVDSGSEDDEVSAIEYISCLFNYM